MAFTSQVNADLSLINAYMQFDSKYNSERQLAYEQKMDAAKLRALLNIQEGIIDLQKGQIVILQKVGELPGVISRDVQIQLANSVFKDMASKTDLTKQILHSLSYENLNDIERNKILVDANFQLRNYRGQRQRFFKEVEILGFVESMLSIVWENERALLEVTDSPKRTKIDTATIYLALTRSALNINNKQSIISLANFNRKNVKDYFSRINNIMTSGSFKIQIPRNPTKVENLSPKNTELFWCGESITTHLSSVPSHVYQRMSKELKGHNGSGGEFLVEGPDSRYIKGRPIIKGVSVVYPISDFKIKPFYDGYPKIVFQSGKIKRTICKVDNIPNQNGNGPPACESVKRKDYITLPDNRLVCSIPKNRVLIPYDGKSRLDKWYANSLEISAHAKESFSGDQQRLNQYIDEYNTSLEALSWLEPTVEHLKLLEERLLDYLLAMGEENPNVGWVTEGSLLRTANQLNYLRIKNLDDFKTETNKEIVKMRYLLEAREKIYNGILFEINQAEKELTLEHPLAFATPILSYLKAAIAVRTAVDEYTLSRSMGNDNGYDLNNFDFSNMQRSPAGDLTMIDDTELHYFSEDEDLLNITNQGNNLEQINNNLSIIDSRFDSGYYSDQSNLERDMRYISNTLERLNDLDTLLVNRKDLVDKLVEKGTGFAGGKAIDQVVDKMMRTGLFQMVKDGGLGDGTPTSPVRVLEIQENAGKITQKLYKRLLSAQILRTPTAVTIPYTRLKRIIKQ